MSYTKGVWKFERGKFNVKSDEGNKLCIGSIVANGKRYIARIENAGEDVANAHLIAAAPLLYEACNTFATALKIWQLDPSKAPITLSTIFNETIGQALASARGEE